MTKMTYSVREAANILGVCQATIRRMCERGQLSYTRTNGETGHYLISVEAIQQKVKGAA